MATEFLATNQTESEYINRDNGSTQSGAVLIAFFGTMGGDEKWQIEQSDADSTANPREWVAVHSTDFLTATHPPGTANQTATVDRWMGARDGNRVFEIPIGNGFIYRVRLVYKGGTTSLTNGNVTACWAEAKTKLWL